MSGLLQSYIDGVISAALEEDISYMDITSDNLIPEGHCSRAAFIAKDDGVLCGLDIALRVFELAGGSVTAEKLVSDGDRICRNDVIARLSGDTRTILRGERTSLNLLQHLSGIATKTAHCVALTEGTGVSVADTRKTLPGLRAMQKYAVTVGGGRNHRFNLSDAAMIKDNHIDACGSISDAVGKLRARVGHMVKIEVEVRGFEELTEALSSGADVIMLDNMSVAQMSEAVRIVGGRALLEASGCITEDNIAEVAATGVDIISLGALTHSVKAFDISLKIEAAASKERNREQ